MAPSRGFEEITITPLGQQSGRERYPRKYVMENDIEIPRCTAWSMNLTALSQIYNMYLVAYGDKVHIYKPTGPQQLLTTQPLLILDLPSTPQALHIRNTNPFSSHSINHLIIGNLGTQEILLCACADGDVVAYYTSPLQRIMKSLSSPSPLRPTASPALHTPDPPTPFFHENVGISAWGLAIHSHSRLLAISSNNHEVQVFAFALSPLSHPIFSSPPPLPPPSSTPPQTFPELYLPPSHPHLPPPSRTRNFRVRLPLGKEGDNIPSIAFASALSGEATSVIASDIRGALWILPLWWRPMAPATPTRIPTVPSAVDVQREPQGWGVLVLDEMFFKPVVGEVEAFGCAPTVNGEGEWDISSSVGEVGDSNVWRREGGGGGWNANQLAVVLGIVAGDEDGGEDVEFLIDGDDDDDEEGGEEEEDFDDDFNEDDDDDDDDDDHDHDIEASMIPAPLPTIHLPQPLPHSHSPSPSPSPSPPPPTTPPLPLPPHHTLLHANRHTLTLHPPPGTGARTICTDILRQDISHALPRRFGYAMGVYNRLNMLVPIPGCSVVIVGSQVGRVAVMRIGRVVGRERDRDHDCERERERDGDWDMGDADQGDDGLREGTPTMRIDAILPLASQEVVGGPRPTTGLLGVAVSPMPGELDEGDDGVADGAADEYGDKGGEGVGVGHKGGNEKRKQRRGVRRWKVIMQYWDLSVLSYVISDERALGVDGF